ncbi:MAG: DUF4340 domain-containing protein [Acetobacteraceae bacterium]
MKPRTSAILVAVAVVVLVAGWFFGPHQNPAEQEQPAQAPLFFPGLAPRLGVAARIAITSGGKQFVMVRKGDVWGLPDRGFYPVELAKVHSMLAGLALLRRLAPRTADAAEYATLGVADPTKAGSPGSLVTVSDASGHPIVSLIIGKQRDAGSPNSPQTEYVRQPGQQQSWLAEGPLTIDGQEDVWIDHSLANVSHDQIVHISVTRGEEQLELAPKDGKLVLLSPADHPPLDPDKLTSVWRALESLSFSHVESGPKLPGKTIASTVFKTKGGTAVTATLALDGKQLWARFATSGSGKDAKELAAKFGNWAFELGDWRESELAPKLADLVKQTAPAKP